MPALYPLRPERSAHATIRGYLYQTCLGVLRWLDLGDNLLQARRSFQETFR